jgi:glycosyltransferase involved in cell wall biosynthesis
MIPRPVVLLLSAAHPAEDVRVVQKEGAALASAGFAVIHLCPGREGDAWHAHGVRIETYARRGGLLGRALALPALARRAAALRPAVIHANEPDAWAAALLAARHCGARVVLDVHEHYPSAFAGLHAPRALRPAATWLVRAAGRAMSARADAVVVAKDGIGADYRGRIVEVRNHAPAADAPPPRLHAPLPVAELVHAGVMTRARGWPVLLDAMARMVHPVRLRLIGRFTDGSQAAFRARAAAHGLGARVRIEPWMPREEMLRAVAAADIGVVLFQPGIENHRLALPHKLFDAMACGLPVVAPRAAEEVARVVSSAGAGLLVDAADADDVARALDALAADWQLRARLGAAGRAAALGPLSWEQEATRLVSLYRDLLCLPYASSAPAAMPVS